MKECFHGGQLYNTIGLDFSEIILKEQSYAADVLDAWFDPAPSIVKSIKENSGWIARTSPSASNLHIADLLASEYNVKSDHIVIGQGSSDLIFRMLPSIVDDKGTIIVEPAYGEYRHVIGQILQLPVLSFGTESNDFDLDIDRLISFANENMSSTIVIINPCNPTGKVVSKGDLIRLRNSISPDVTLVIDETYSEYIGRRESLIDSLDDYPNICIFKSLSKTYSLSGLRAGFCAWNSSITKLHRDRTPPYILATPTQMALHQIFENQFYYQKMIASTHANREHFKKCIEELIPEIIVIDSKINCVLLDLKNISENAAELVHLLRERKVFIRNIDSQGGDSLGRYVRVSVLAKEDMSHIAAAMKAVVHKRSLARISCDIEYSNVLTNL